MSTTTMEQKPETRAERVRNLTGDRAEMDDMISAYGRRVIRGVLRVLDGAPIYEALGTLRVEIGSYGDEWDELCARLRDYRARLAATPEGGAER